MFGCRLLTAAVVLSTTCNIHRAETSFGEVRWSHLLQAVDATLPSDAKKGLTKQFYLLFWRLTFSDISNASPE